MNGKNQYGIPPYIYASLDLTRCVMGHAGGKMTLVGSRYHPLVLCEARKKLDDAGMGKDDALRPI